ncbi:MAG: hypothetical protein GDA35_04965 [Hyphomonadaceae bacterium]|nr:hypothetical protein [Hyphomonadaceae bacterium]
MPVGVFYGTVCYDQGEPQEQETGMPITLYGRATTTPKARAGIFMLPLPCLK